MSSKVTVFGSYVVDLMARSPHLPAPAETVKGSLFKMGAGGKGFNQCVAAHKARQVTAYILDLRFWTLSERTILGFKKDKV